MSRRNPAHSSPRRRGRGTARNWLLRPPLRLFAVLVAAAPFLLATRLLSVPTPLTMAPQYAPPAASVTSAELAGWQEIGADLPPAAAPVVLAYHDVRPNSPDPYVVSPVQLDRELSAFAAAGYHTLTTDQFVAYLNGGPTPPRGLYLTFDDGTQGLYQYADPILERNHMTAASFLITGRVGFHEPYYLTWPEVSEMAASGRWDFQAHTHNLHDRGAVGPRKAYGSVLTGSAWPTPTRMETVAEHTQRVNADLTQMFRDFADHHLPRPQVFAYPFSEADASYDATAVQATAAIIKQDFAAALTNKTDAPTPVSRRSGADRVVERLEVFGSTDPTTLLDQIAAWTEIPPQIAHPLADTNRWWDEGSRDVAQLGQLIGENVPTDPRAQYLSADYAPYGSADWMNYAVTTDVLGLRREGNNANVIVRTGSPGEAEVRTSCCSVQVVDVASSAVLGQARLPAAESHRVRIDITNGAVAVTVDNMVALKVKAGNGLQYTGGISIASRRGGSTVWPYFANMSIVEEL